MGTSIAYIRKSSAPSRSVRTVSYEVQEQAVRELAARHGDELSAILTDWGKSGGSTRRPDYQRLLGMVDRGELTSIYSYSLSRLSRSLLDFADLVERCNAHKVRIRLVQEGDVDTTTASGRAWANNVANFAQFERELAVERNLAAVSERRGRGDILGQAPYGYRVKGSVLVKRDDERPDLVFEAYKQARSFGGAARLLNEWKVPTRREGTRWIHGTVADIIRAQAPKDLRPPIVKRRGASPIGGALFTALLRCPCGAILTPRKDDKAPRGVGGYYCSRSNRTPNHGRMHVPEWPILDWVKPEAARLELPAAIIEDRAQDEALSDELKGRRDRIVESYIDGLVSKEERDARLVSLDAQLEALGNTSRLTAVPALDWDAPVPEVNNVLRAIFSEIQLGADLHPVEAVWRVPSLRRP